MSSDRSSGGFHCPLCGGGVFRRSRWTFADVPHLLLLEIPLRCQDCGERAYVLLPKAMKALSFSADHRSKLNQQDH
jgi:DNA-directed RNA polymerase subunit RPC12/RpoP